MVCVCDVLDVCIVVFLYDVYDVMYLCISDMMFFVQIVFLVLCSVPTIRVLIYEG